MKQIFSILAVFVLVSASLYGQSGKRGIFQREFENTFLRLFRVSDLLFEDSTCFVYNDVLKVEIDRNSQVKKIFSSESGENWMKEEVIRLNEQHSLRFKKLDSLAKTERLKNLTIVFPIVINTGGICKDTVRFPNEDFEKYTLANDKRVKIKNTIVARTIYSNHLPPIRCGGGVAQSAILATPTPIPYYPSRLIPIKDYKRTR